MLTNRRNIPQYLLVSALSFVLTIALLSVFPSIGRFQFTDFYYSRFMKPSPAPADIGIVNIENCKRQEIAALITKLKSGRPAVIGLDVIFPPREDSGNAALNDALQSDSIVFSYISSFQHSNKTMPPSFLTPQSRSGFANMVGASRENSTVRVFHPWYKNEPSFAVAVVSKYNPALLAYDSSDNKEIDIRYRYREGDFRELSYATVMDSSFDMGQVKGRIILLGYIGTGLPDRHDHFYMVDEDKFFTPLNERIIGRSYPDMYGVQVHANIIAMITDGKAVYMMPRAIIFILGFVLVFAVSPILASMYNRKGILLHAGVRLIQLIIVALLITLAILLYANASVKVDVMPMVLMIVAAGESVLLLRRFR